MSLIEKLEQRIRQSGGLIVSCQPIPGGPMDHPEIVAAMSLAAAQSGAAALRIEGINNLRAVREKVKIPIIGIIKHALDDSPVRITPFIADVDALVAAGADIIAFDGTQRPRPADVETLINHIHQHGLPAIADCSCYEDAMQCHALGADFIATTLSGYTSIHTPTAPDLALVNTLARQGCKVIAEGRYNTPAQAAEAMRQGAWAVTVGSAITRIENVCQWYREAMTAE